MLADMLEQRERLFHNDDPDLRPGRILYYVAVIWVVSFSITLVMLGFVSLW